MGKSAKRKPAELAKGCLTVAQVVAVLKKLPQDKLVLPVVGWAGDSAFAEADAGIHVRTDEDGNVLIEGWLSNCGTELEIVEEEEGP